MEQGVDASWGYLTHFGQGVTILGVSLTLAGKFGLDSSGEGTYFGFFFGGVIIVDLFILYGCETFFFIDRYRNRLPSGR